FLSQPPGDLCPTPQMRAVAKAFRFVIPGHMLTSLLLLWFNAYGRWQDDLENLVKKREARILEYLLPAVACLFIFGSIRKQMKNFFVSGMVFLAAGIVMWQFDLFENKSRWPISLLILGALLMVMATRYSTIKMAVAGFVAAGCDDSGNPFVVSLRPFYTKVDLEADPGLTGSWRDKEGDVSFTFQEGEEKEYTLVVKEREGDQETSGEFEAHLLRL